MKGRQTEEASGISWLKGGCEERKFPSFLYMFFPVFTDVSWEKFVV